MPLYRTLPSDFLALTIRVICGKMDIGGNELGRCLRGWLLLLFYDNSNFFGFRFTLEFKVELYLHTHSPFVFVFTKYKRESGTKYLPRTYLESQIPVESLSILPGLHQCHHQNLLFINQKYPQPR